MLKHTTRLFIAISFLILVGLPSKAFLPAPFKSISINNLSDKFAIKPGDSVEVKVNISKDYDITKLELLGSEIDALTVCDELECVLENLVQVSDVKANLSRDLVIHYIKHSDKNLRHAKKIIFPVLPFITKAENISEPIWNIRLNKSNSAFRNITFSGDVLTLSFKAKPDFHAGLIDYIKVNDLILDKSQFIITTKSLGAAVNFKTSFKVPEDFITGRLNFEIKLSNGNRYTETSNGLIPSIVSHRAVQNIFNFNSDNEINPVLLTKHDNLFIEFKSSSDLLVQSISINDKTIPAGSLERKCHNHFCNNNLLVNVDPSHETEKINFHMTYLEDGELKTLSKDLDLHSLPNYVFNHVLNRVTFGKTPENYHRITQLGWRGFIHEQLNPESIDNSFYESQKVFKSHSSYAREHNLAMYVYDRMLYSKHELLEKMTWFWENHFSTRSSKWSSVDWKVTRDDNKDYSPYNPLDRKFRGSHDGMNIDDTRFDGYLVIAYQNNLEILNIDSRNYDTLEMYFNYYKYPEANKAKFYWMNEASGYKLDEANSISFDTPTNRKYHKVSFNLSDKASWKGKLYGVAFKPFSNENTKDSKLHVGTDFIKLVDSTGKNSDLILSASSSYAERDTNDYFRKHAFGNFKDLLNYDAKSPSMLYYLDNWLNNSKHSNENYAREVMELHTLGVNGGYAEEDVPKVAKIFSGLTFTANKFYYDTDIHTFEDLDVSFLNEVIPAGEGLEGFKNQVDTFLEKLAEHSSTADYICYKLIEYFVNEDVPLNLHLKCKDTFMNNHNSSNQMKLVMESILLDDEFIDYAHYRSKFLNPMLHGVKLAKTAYGEGLFSRYNKDIKKNLFDYTKAQGYVPGFQSPPDWL